MRRGEHFEVIRDKFDVDGMYTSVNYAQRCVTTSMDQSPS
jgi:hypothetical protein